jgi:hypothetical protein
MVTITVSLTDDQARRMLAAAEFVGEGTKIEDLVLANAFAHLDEWEHPESEVMAFLRDGIRVYCREQVAVPFDLSTRAISIGVS